MKSRFAVPPCSSDIIKRDWIKDALERFVELKLATRKNDNYDNYEIYFRKYGRNDRETRIFLLNLKFKPKKDKEKNEDKEQMTMDKYYGNNNTINA
jgi:hypothetical protein